VRGEEFNLKWYFLKVGRFVLSYRLLPLLKKQLVISKIEIVSPSISIKKEKEGKYNFSDITEKRSLLERSVCRLAHELLPEIERLMKQLPNGKERL
jgi:hypothetical protein